MSMTTEDEFYQKVRLLQRRTKCSNFVCKQFVDLFRQNAEDKNNLGSLSSFDKKSKRVAGVNYLALHGCPSCNKHVYTHKDKNKVCPFIKANGTVCGHPRYSEQNEPLDTRKKVKIRPV